MTVRRTGSVAQRKRPSSAELVERAAAGDRDAFVRVLRRHDPRLRALAGKLLAGDRDRIDDVLQNAYLKAYRALRRFEQRADVGTWLYRITYNACVDELRRAARRPEPVDTTRALWDRPAERSAPDAVVATADVTARALAALPADQRIAVVMVDGEGLDQATATELLGIPTGTLASRLARGRARLRLLLEETE